MGLNGHKRWIYEAHVIQGLMLSCKEVKRWVKNKYVIFSSCVWAYMCCLLCLQWAFSLNHWYCWYWFSQTYTSYRVLSQVCVCVCVFVPVLKIRRTLSVHGAETLSKGSEASSLCSPIFIVNVICRPRLYFGDRERVRVRERGSERGIKQFFLFILNRRPNAPPFRKVGDLRTNGFRFRNIEPSE